MDPPTFTHDELRALAAMVRECSSKYLREDVVGGILKSEACIVLREVHGQDGLDQAAVDLAHKVERLR